MGSLNKKFQGRLSFMTQSNNPAQEYSLAARAKNRVQAETSVSPEHILTFTFSGNSLHPEASKRILAQEKNSDNIVYFETVPESAEQLSIDLSALENETEYKRKKSYRFFLEETAGGKSRYYSITENRPSTTSKSNHAIFADGIWFQEDYETEATEYVAALYTEGDNFLCAVLCSRNALAEDTLACLLRKLSMRRGILTLRFDLETGFYSYAKTIFRFRNKLAEDAAAYDFVTSRIREKDGRLSITATLDLNSIEWKSLYWDVRIELNIPGTSSVCQMPIFMDTRCRVFHKFLYNGSFRGENDFFLYPYYTGKQTLAFVYRQKGKYDGMDIVLKEFLSILIYRLTKPYWKKKHICLVCEKFSEMAQDNGYYFFKHCMEENEEKYLKKQIYYIITKDSPDRKKLAPYKDHLLDFMTIRHMCYLLAADLIVSSDSRYHTYAMQSRHSIFNRYIKKIPFVFLQHGVIALKQVDFFYGKGKRGGCDLFVVSTEDEKKIIVDNFGYDPEEVINTGLPRWDVLHDKSQDKREILIMPTWRNWLDSVPDEDFEQSDYFRNYMELLNSRRFLYILEKYNLQVNFYLHAKFQEYADTFRAKGSRIHLISFGEVAVNEMLMRCRMLITDYSSVCWDVLYQDKPILFYQFDLDKYEEAQGSYLNMRTELFGDRAENCDELLDKLEEQIKNDFHMKPEYEAMRKRYFRSTDHTHSRQICECIKNLL